MEGTKQLTPRQKTLLAFLGSDAEQELNPIRVMKGLFLISQETPKDWLDTGARYEFVPYHYGPCSFPIYDDLDCLQRLGYVKTMEVPGRSWKYYTLSAEGVSVANAVIKEFRPELRKYLKDVRAFVARLSVRQLLDVIYKAYPSLATNSIFKF